MVVGSNDFADEIEYLKLLTMMVIVSSCYYIMLYIMKRAFSSYPMSFILKNCSGGCAPDPKVVLT